ncbi:MAG TPA: DUF4129 domain-containing protein [Anaerolineae bacterium]|nr:DUF4129 domain-containing protein [Anaerolineae bacterium]
MTNRRKLWIILVSSAAVTALILLAGGLSRIELQPGRLFALGSGTATAPGSNLPSGEGILAVWRTLMTALMALLPAAIIVLIVSPRARKRVLRLLLYLGLLLLVVYLALINRQIVGTDSAPLDAAPTPDLAATPEVIGEFAARPPEWLVFMFSLSLIALAAGVAWLLWRRAHPPAPLFEQVAHEAQQALTELRAGGDVKDVVLRCYLEMSLAINAQRGVRRQPGMTPREFERRLAGIGFPPDPVQRLTRLFERARYGSKVAGAREQNEAIACLTAIVEAGGIAA